MNFIFLTFIEVWTQWVASKVNGHAIHCVHTSMNVRKMKFISSLSSLNSSLASDPAAALFVSLTLGFVIQNTVGPLQIKNTTITVMILSFRTYRSGQTDQGLHCLPFRLHLLVTLLYGKTILLKFYDYYSNFRVSVCLGFLRLLIFKTWRTFLSTIIGRVLRPSQVGTCMRRRFTIKPIFCDIKNSIFWYHKFDFVIQKKIIFDVKKSNLRYQKIITSFFISQNEFVI